VNLGVWIGAFTVALAAEARPAAREIDELGYDTLWYPEGLGTRESFTNAAVLLGATEGDEEAIRTRVQEHLDAGLTQVAIQPLERGDRFGGETLRRLAPALLT
jgi:hypothetical protein